MGLLWRRISAEQTPPPWGLLTAVGVALAAFAAVLMAAGIVGSFGGQTTTTTLLAYCLGMVLIALFVTVTRNRTPADGEALAIGASSSRMPLILMLSFGVGAAFDLITLAFANVPLITAEFASVGGVAAVHQAGLVGWLLMAVLLLILQPIADGMVFRGVAYPALRTYLGPVAGFFMAAAWHGIFHMVVYSTPSSSDFASVWVTLVAPILAGIYLSAVRAATGSTRVAMVAQAGLGLFFLVRAFTVVMG